jgi:hypothetical protein
LIAVPFSRAPTTAKPAYARASSVPEVMDCMGILPSPWR